MKWILSLVILIGLIVVAANISSFVAFKVQKPTGESIEFVNNPNGILVEEFSDFQCPYCKRALPYVNYIKEKYAGQINFKYKHFPLPGHSDAIPAALASECAREQGKFWKYHDILFENQNSLQISNLYRFANASSLNMNKFEICMEEQRYKEKILKEIIEGQARGVPGTPTFFVNGKQVYPDQLKKAIEEELS